MIIVSFRVVDFSYMPDLAMENARNVTINLKEEHGQYVMLQLSFAAKWILISEITFFSGKIQKLLNKFFYYLENVVKFHFPLNKIV